MGVFHDDKIAHARQLGAGDRDLAIVRIRQELRQQQIESFVAGNHPDRIRHRWQRTRDAVRTSAQLRQFMFVQVDTYQNATQRMGNEVQGFPFPALFDTGLYRQRRQLFDGKLARGIIDIGNNKSSNSRYFMS